MPFLERERRFVQTEKSFQHQVEQLAALYGWKVRHDVATNGPRACPNCKEPLHLPRNEAGWPDLVLTRRPRIIFAELKSDRGVLTPAQKLTLDDLMACGLEVYVWRPRDWSDIERVLKRRVSRHGAL